MSIILQPLLLIGCTRPSTGLMRLLRLFQQLPQTEPRGSSCLTPTYESLPPQPSTHCLGSYSLFAIISLLDAICIDQELSSYIPRLIRNKEFSSLRCLRCHSGATVGWPLLMERPPFLAPVYVTVGWHQGNDTSGLMF